MEHRFEDEVSIEERRSRRGMQLDAAGWTIFFVWITAMIFVRGIPEGVGALGLGILTLAGTAARLVLGASISAFWIIIGLLFLFAGIGEMMGLGLPLTAFALIVCGVLLLLHRHRPKRRA